MFNLVAVYWKRRKRENNRVVKPRMNSYIVTCLILSLFVSIASAQQPVLNEIMASNATTIADIDGDYPDWIEIFNPTSSPLNLTGYALSDDSTNLLKWIFPEVILQPQQFLLVFASGKNRRLWANHWETVINRGDVWKYFVGTSQPPADWMQLNFDDSAWPAGPSGLGYGDGDDSTIVPQTISLFIRRKFTVSDPANVVLAQLHVDYDDAFVAYLNGVEIARANIGIPGVPPLYNELANSSHEAQMYQGGLPQAFSIDSVASLLQAGENVLAIQVHNVSASSSDMTIIPFLSLGLKTPPPNPQGMPSFLQFALPHLHTNFKINADGEEIFLSDGNGVVVDQVNAGSLSADISYGRQPDGWPVWFYFSRATPESSNTSQGFSGITEMPQIQPEAGFYSGSVQVSISSNEPGATIRYTLDGSLPRDTSAIYIAPLTVDSTTVVRARVFVPGKLPGKAATSTFFINENSVLPVISLSTDPANFFDNEIGIYVLGDSASPNFPYLGANFWKDWERPLHIELFEPDGSLDFTIDGGVKIFGGWSRGFPQKSLAIFARGRYGYNRIEFPIFPELPISSFKSLVLRNSGNDWQSTMFRDALMTRLVKTLDLDLQAYRPAIVFLNGRYWGIHNIREKLNEHYLASHHGVDPGNVDILEYDGSVIEGDAAHYQMLQDFLSTHNLSDSANYAFVKKLVDVDNFLTYQVCEIYFDNTDWPGNNIKYWRPRTPTGRWRWFFYDLDFGCGLYDPQAYAHNTLEFATATNGPPWPNPPWSTFLLRKMLESPEFTRDFINRFADLMNTVFLPQRVLQFIDSLQALIAPEIPRHMDRWHGILGDWNQNVTALRTFAALRPQYMRAHIQSKFNLSGSVQVTVQVQPAEAGRIRLNALLLKGFPWNGQYFKGVPVRFTALPAAGYRFVGWQGAFPPDSTTIWFTPVSDTAVTALFVPDSTSTGTVVINEINYHSAPDFNPEDWVEFYNNSGQTIDLSGWKFKDSDDAHVFVFPAGTVLLPDEYLVLCRDTAAFRVLFPTLSNYLGNMNFGLSGAGELVRLFDAQGEMVDSLVYDDAPPWPTAPDGNGPTLELIHPDLDNALPESWAASAIHGTPGAINSVYSALEDGKSTLPRRFYLYPNYPNPFNPLTTISWEMPQRAKVELTVFDVSGRKIETLIQRSMPAGTHKVVWKPSRSLASGVYFYRIKIGSHYVRTRKLLLIR